MEVNELKVILKCYIQLFLNQYLMPIKYCVILAPLSAGTLHARTFLPLSIALGASGTETATEKTKVSLSFLIR